jgi:hypothetical protein
MSQFLDKTVAAEWRANHTVSIRANLVQTKKNPITEDFIFDLDKEIGRGGVGAVVVGESKKEKSALYAIKLCDKAAVSVSRLTREVLLLKDVDAITHLSLCDVSPDVIGVAADVSHVNTRGITKARAVRGSPPPAGAPGRGPRGVQGFRATTAKGRAPHPLRCMRARPRAL